MNQFEKGLADGIADTFGIGKEAVIVKPVVNMLKGFGGRLAKLTKAAKPKFMTAMSGAGGYKAAVLPKVSLAAPKVTPGAISPVKSVLSKVRSAFSRRAGISPSKLMGH